ncbi:MAG: UDP-3-O-(3-hydroxymyristoyl)glucosamine N-acyltransferase [Alphaproteobacteria bacterium]|nr:UDP-3-O-(3-hydroxymyristoyl)glucosamine N-acyltransferase [Alphaproteobacteria bacterium]
MPDPRFFQAAGPFSLSRLAEIAGAVLADGADGDYRVEAVAALDVAGVHEISFLDNMRYKDQFSSTKAGACIVHPDFAPEAPEGVHLLFSQYPYKSYALIAQALYPERGVAEAFVSEQAYIAEDVQIGQGCVIEPGVVIRSGAKIGASCWIGAQSVIGENVELGEGVRIGENATVSHALIGDYSRLYPGVRVGQDGFGFAIDPSGHVKVPQLGRVIIESHVEIGANTTIDRGAGPDTVIGQGTWIDNLVQIGHNVKIGRGCVIVAQVGISGSTVLEDFVAIGGQAGLAGHLRIGQGARIAAQTGVMRDLQGGQEYMGYPALPIRQFMKQVALLKRLADKKER